MSHRRHGRLSRSSRRTSSDRHIENLESRTLFSGDPKALAAAGFTALEWNGQQAYAKAGEWILRLDGIAGKRNDQLNAVNGQAKHLRNMPEAVS